MEYLSTRFILFTLHSTLMALTVIAWGVYSRECDQSEQLKQQIIISLNILTCEAAELAWLGDDRSGIVFMFGPQGEEPHYFDRGEFACQSIASISSIDIILLHPMSSWSFNGLSFY